ncbi:MAG: ABC transporter permease [Actinobacteria bacterium]|nr:ABC transporter permease [Actinomycetota bacterium]
MSDGELRRGQWRGAGALAQREVTRVLRLWSQTIAPNVVSAALFVAIFGLALGSRIRQVGGVDYETFIVPGLVVMGIGTAAYSNTASSLYQARFDGFIDDPVSGPMRARHLLAAYLAGGVVRGLAIGAATLVAAGFMVDVPLEHPLPALVAFVGSAVAFSALGVVVGLVARTWDQQSYVGNLVLQPLVFLGGVFYSMQLLAEPWRSLTRGDPILYLVAFARDGMLGTAEVSAWAGLGVTVGLSVGMVAWAGILVARGTGLRT